MIRYHGEQGKITVGRGDRAIHLLRGHHPWPLVASAASVASAAALILVPGAGALPRAQCQPGAGSEQIVGAPTPRIAWRAKLLETAPVYASAASIARRAEHSISPSQAGALLVLAAQGRAGRCWLKVRLPTRPNTSAGWINSERVQLSPTRWRIVISLATRTLTVEHAGTATRRFRVVIGAEATPTPSGLFSVIGAWRSPPGSFLGSWILALLEDAVMWKAVRCARRVRRWPHVRSSLAGVSLLSGLVLGLSGSVASAWATMPGFPTEPQPPTTVYSEGFENGVGQRPVLLTSYVGPAPLKQRYTAQSDFLKNCNGYIVEFKSNERTQATDCAVPAFANVRQMAWALGSLRGEPDPTTNHAVTAYTDGGTLTANSVQFETVTPIALSGAGGRFITFSVDASETNCSSSHAMFKFYLLSGASEIPTFTSPIDPCSDPSATTITAPPIAEQPAKEYKVGRFAGNDAKLFSGSQLGIRMRNGQASTVGNDAAFDEIKVLDATPQLDKSFSPTVLSVGGVSQLTFTITNTSELAAKDGWGFTDTLPGDLVVAPDPNAATTCAQPTVVKATAGGSVVSVTGNLGAGVNYCTVAIDVSSDAVGSYTNGPGNMSDETGINPPGPATVTFTPNADLQIEKSASPIPAIPGSQETYTLTVTNKGPDTAQEVLVTDQLPAGLSLSSASPGCQLVEPPLSRAPRRRSPVRLRRTAERGPTVGCALGSLALGAHTTITLTVQVASTVTEGFVNVAVVSSATPDPDPSNNQAEAATPVPPAADLEIQKTASLATVPAGGQVSYTLLVKNNGPHEATSVVVADPLPAGLAVVSALPSQGECATATGVICRLGAIMEGASAQILVTANVDDSAGGSVENTATVAGGQTDPDHSNNTSSATIDVTPLTPAPPPLPPASEVLASTTALNVPDQPISDLRVLKHVDTATAHVGQRLTYTLEVTNDGPDPAPAVQLTDTWSLDAKILFVHTPRGSCRRAQPLTCSLGALQAGETLRITIVAAAERPGQQRNTAKVTSSDRDPNLENNQSSAETRILATRRPQPPPIVTG